MASPSKIQTAYGEHYQDGKFLKSKPIVSTGTYKRSGDSITNLESASFGRISKDVTSPLLESKDLDKHKAGSVASRDLTHRSRVINDPDGVHHASRDRAVSQAESQSRKLLNCENETEISTKIRRKERYGTDGHSNMDSAVVAYPMQMLVSYSLM